MAKKVKNEEKSRPMLIVKYDGKTLRFKKTTYKLIPLAGLADALY